MDNVDELINIEFCLQEKGFHPGKEEWIEIMKLYNFILDHAHENEKRIKFLTTLENIINFLKEGTNFRYKREKFEIDISKWNKQKPIKINLYYSEDTRYNLDHAFVLRTYQKEEFYNDIFSIMKHRPLNNYYTSSVMIKNCFITKNEKLIIIIGMEFSDGTLNEKEINKVFTQEFKEQEITVYWGNNG